jgi:hypothetical protein
MQIRLLDYFLSKDIADSVVVHAMMKTRDAATNILGALNVPGLQATANTGTFRDIARVASHVLDQCIIERRKVDERMALGSRFIDSLAS